MVGSGRKEQWSLSHQQLRQSSPSQLGLVFFKSSVPYFLCLLLVCCFQSIFQPASNGVFSGIIQLFNSNSIH